MAEILNASFNIFHIYITFPILSFIYKSVQHKVGCTAGLPDSKCRKCYVPCDISPYGSIERLLLCC